MKIDEILLEIGEYGPVGLSNLIIRNRFFVFVDKQGNVILKAALKPSVLEKLKESFPKGTLQKNNSAVSGVGKKKKKNTEYRITGKHSQDPPLNQRFKTLSALKNAIKRYSKNKSYLEYVGDYEIDGDSYAGGKKQTIKVKEYDLEYADEPKKKKGKSVKGISKSKQPSDILTLDQIKKLPRNKALAYRLKLGRLMKQKLSNDMKTKLVNQKTTLESRIQALKK